MLLTISGALFFAEQSGLKGWLFSMMDVVDAKYELAKMKDVEPVTPILKDAISNADGKLHLCKSGDYVEEVDIVSYMRMSQVAVEQLQKFEAEVLRSNNSKLERNRAFNELIVQILPVIGFYNSHLVKCYRNWDIAETVSKRARGISNTISRYKAAL